VWTYNESTGKNELKTVGHVFVNQDPAITYLTLKNEDGSSEPIITTPEHPFYVQEKAKNTPSSTGYGPKLSSSKAHGDLGPNWVGAGYLSVGDILKTAQGWGTVVNVTTVAETRTMYNLSVQGNHDFFVGEKGWLVHNAGNIVYRVIRPDEDPSKGLFPKNPNATFDLDYHVRYGSKPNVRTQYISTTRDINVAAEWAAKSGNRIVIIDLDAVGGTVYDLSTDIGRQQYILKYRPFSTNFAKKSAEVLIEGNVPANAVRVLCP